MIINEFFKYCRTISNKDSAGDGFAPDQFNGQVKIVSIEKFQSYWKLVESIAKSDKKDMATVIFELQDLSVFITVAELFLEYGTEGGGNTTVANANYPPDFRYTLGMMVDNKPADFKSYTEISKYRRGLLNGNPDDRPQVFEGSGKYEFIPNDVAQATLTYLRIPATPYYDWCLNEDDVEVFIPVGGKITYSHQLQKYVLYDAGGLLVATGVIRDDLTVGVTYQSKSVNLDWPDTIHLQLANSVLEKLGVNLRSPEIVQFAQAQEK